MQDKTTDRREALTAQLAEGIDALTRSDEWRRYLEVQAKFHRYSFANTLLILRQCPGASQVASYRKWQELGRQVRNGEHGLWIWAPCTRKVTPADDGEAITADGEAEARRVLSGFRPVPVFDVAQTDGDDLPEICHLLDGEDDSGVFDRLAAVAEGMDWTVRRMPEVDGHQGANGLCEHGLRVITVASARSPLQQVKTLAHELGHGLLHGPAVYYAGNRGLCELEAESVAFVVCASLGVDTSAYSFGYVAGWQQGDAARAREAIKASGNRIQRAAGQILTALEKTSERELVPA
jgi:antirestriction protein ArdC